MNSDVEPAVDLFESEIMSKSASVAKDEPTPAEVADRNLTHLPDDARSDVCLEDHGHETIDPCPVVVPRPTKRIASGFCFFGKNPSRIGNEKLLPGPGAVLVIYDTDTGGLASCKVLDNGPNEQYCVAFFRSFLNTLDTTKFICQTDGESTIDALLQIVKDEAKNEYEIHLRQTPVGDHQSNSFADSAMCGVQRQVRALTLHVEKRYDVDIRSTDLFFGWIVRHAGWLMTRFAPRDVDNQTPYYITHGVEYQGLLAEIGECVMGRVGNENKTKSQRRWERGIFVGKDDFTDEWLIITEKGLLKCRKCRRLPSDGAFDKTLFLKVKDQLLNSVSVLCIARGSPTAEVMTCSTSDDSDVAIVADDVEPLYQGSSVEVPSVSSRTHMNAPHSLEQWPNRSPDDADADDIEIERVVAGLVDLSLESPHDDDGDDDEHTGNLCKLSDEHEIEQMKKFDVHTDVPRENATTSVISTLSVRKLKSHEAWCRIVARELRAQRSDDTFAATSIAEGSRVIDMLAGKLNLCTCTADVSTVFMRAIETEDVFVEPPEGYVSEEFVPGTFVWKLKKKVYGLKSFPPNWQTLLAEQMRSLGFSRGVFEPTFFYHQNRNLYVDRHVDDLHAAGLPADLRWMFDELSKHLVIKVGDVMGSGSSDEFFRARISEDMLIVSNSRYIDETVSVLKLESANTMTTTGLQNGQPKHDDEELPGKCQNVDRSLELSSYRPDIQWAIGELYSALQGPSVEDWRRLKHLMRYLIGTVKVGLSYPANGSMRNVRVFVGSEWIEDERQRNVNVVSGMVAVGECLLCSWNRKQTDVVAQSSAERDFFSIVTGPNEMPVRNMRNTVASSTTGKPSLYSMFTVVILFLQAFDVKGELVISEAEDAFVIDDLTIMLLTMLSILVLSIIVVLVRHHLQK